MKKLLIIGTLALSAASFANTSNAKTNQMTNMAAGKMQMMTPEMQKSMSEHHQNMMKGRMKGGMMTPEMQKSMSEHHQNMMKGGMMTPEMQKLMSENHQNMMGNQSTR